MTHQHRNRLNSPTYFRMNDCSCFSPFILYYRTLLYFSFSSFSFYPSASSSYKKLNFYESFKKFMEFLSGFIWTPAVTTTTTTATTMSGFVSFGSMQWRVSRLLLLWCSVYTLGAYSVCCFCCARPGNTRPGSTPSSNHDRVILAWHEVPTFAVFPRWYHSLSVLAFLWNPRSLFVPFCFTRFLHPASKGWQTTCIPNQRFVVPSHFRSHMVRTSPCATYMTKSNGNYRGCWPRGNGTLAVTQMSVNF